MTVDAGVWAGFDPRQHACDILAVLDPQWRASAVFDERGLIVVRARVGRGRVDLVLPRPEDGEPGYEVLRDGWWLCSWECPVPLRAAAVAAMFTDKLEEIR
ncbi:hypothetical protein [Actinoplanes rectilineatus]|uniref:hypothetical protein n=1 Tax=Actinoplanes rectilineatus TaxID=113571 RepID=UPI0005F2A688|nr:hypothetical protein [Actinoplanes rectilineatus]